MHLGVVVGGARARIDELVVETLVVPLEMVVLEVLAEHESEVVLAEGDHVIEALPSYFWATSFRYQRRIVSGVTMASVLVRQDPERDPGGVWMAVSAGLHLEAAHWLLHGQEGIDEDGPH